MLGRLRCEANKPLTLVSEERADRRPRLIGRFADEQVGLGIDCLIHPLRQHHTGLHLQIWITFAARAARTCTSECGRGNRQSTLGHTSKKRRARGCGSRRVKEIDRQRSRGAISSDRSSPGPNLGYLAATRRGTAVAVHQKQAQSQKSGRRCEARTLPTSLVSSAVRGSSCFEQHTRHTRWSGSDVLLETKSARQPLPSASSLLSL